MKILKAKLKIVQIEGMMLSQVECWGYSFQVDVGEHGEMYYFSKCMNEENLDILEKYLSENKIDNKKDIGIYVDKAYFE